ncbi:hypothetical protein GCM10009122_56640 [Fulvivirga kasyanovii]|uniref:RDD family protein n=1 Tax=Fulvivirga kasyanovii TaxID=396812 RepID=A0ABW9RNQ4_9BACT|nr:RDD family protein [Fulvivirga kasyanovii]MTI25772.1 RDD family protein [Fulvivirga kasyanovii]
MLDSIPEQPLVKASIGRRIGAFLIDHVAMTFLIVALVFAALGTNFMNEEGVFKMIGTMFLAMIPGMFLYMSKDAIRGISIGKWVMGIMVRNEHDTSSPPTFARLLGRNLLLVIWPVEFLVLVTGNDMKRLGDRVFHTMVFNNPAKPGKLPRILPLIAIAVIAIGGIILFAGSAMKNSDAYKVSVAAIEQNDQIIQETGGIKGYGMMPTGNINISNGYGQAQLNITVLGNEQDITVSTYLEKAPGGEWKLIELY